MKTIQTFSFIALALSAWLLCVGVANKAEQRLLIPGAIVVSGSLISLAICYRDISLKK